MRGGTAKALEGEALKQHQDRGGVPWFRKASSVCFPVSRQDSDFLSVTGLLTGSAKRFSGMARSGRDNRRLLLAVSAALVLVFFILYYLVSRAGS